MRWMAAVLALLATTLAAAADLRPVVPPARPGTQCVVDPALMRRTHMVLLKHQRELTVHEGLRGVRISLAGCVDCHAGSASGHVASASGDFCVACHRYAAVRIDCFDCHSDRPRALVAKETR